MGSRKKRRTIPTEKTKFFTWYRSLSIMDRIAFRSFLFNYNRSRITLADLFKYPYFWQCFGPLKRQQMIEEGYAVRWWKGFGKPYKKVTF